LDLRREGVRLNDPELVTFGSFPPGASAYTLWEVPLFCMLAVVGGLLGALFNALNIRLTAWRQVNVTGNKPRMFLEAIFVAWLSVTCFFFLPLLTKETAFDECRAADVSVGAHHHTELFQSYQCGNSSDFAVSGLYNEMATLSFTGGEKIIKTLLHSHSTFDEPVFSAACLLCYLPVYFVLAVVTYGVKVPSGLFVPGIILGATFGRVMGEAVSAPCPSWNRSTLTEIYLCHASSYHEIEDGNGAPGQALDLHREDAVRRAAPLRAAGHLRAARGGLDAGWRHAHDRLSDGDPARDHPGHPVPPPRHNHHS
jgi:H+/Cl- antiporter ClcA